MDKLCFRDPYLESNNVKRTLMFEMHKDLGHVSNSSPPKSCAILNSSLPYGHR